MTETSARVAVVTGASRGIGRAIALRLVRGGWKVWGLARSAERLSDLTSVSEGKVQPLAVDLSQPGDVLAAARSIAEAGVPDMIVNNAGITASVPLAELSFDDFQRVMAVNVNAAYLMCHELVPLMAQAGRGRVVNIASTAGVKGFKYGAAYCSSKHALIGLTRALAAEFAGRDVTVNAVCPGWSDTDMLRGVSRSVARRSSKSAEQILDSFRNLNPMRRFVSETDVAELVWFLGSSHACAITGSVYMMDAGETLQ